MISPVDITVNVRRFANYAAPMSQTVAELGWVIIYVPDVREALAFYERAFGLEPGGIDAHATFGQLQTGSTALSFATEDRARAELRHPFRPGTLDTEPANLALSFVFDDPYTAFDRAVSAGCVPLAPVEPKPHGQHVGIVRDRYGTIVEIGSPLDPA